MVICYVVDELITLAAEVGCYRTGSLSFVDRVGGLLVVAHVDLGEDHLGEYRGVGSSHSLAFVEVAGRFLWVVIGNAVAAIVTAIAAIVAVVAAAIVAVVAGRLSSGLPGVVVKQGHVKRFAGQLFLPLHQP
jgi:hypothetical protein